MTIRAESGRGPTIAMTRVLSAHYTEGEYRVVETDGSLLNQAQRTLVVWANDQQIECDINVIRTVATGPTSGRWLAIIQDERVLQHEASASDSTNGASGRFPHPTPTHGRV